MPKSSQVIAITCEALVEELGDVLKRPKFTKYLERIEKTPDEIIAEYLTYTMVVTPADVLPNVIRDMKDVKVLAAALGGKVTYIVSGDDDLLVLKQYEDIAIVNVITLLNTIK